MIAFQKKPILHRDRNEEIDLGLALLSVARKPGVRISAHDIAAWCGCSKRYIEAEERRAVNKLRLRMVALGITSELSGLLRAPSTLALARRMKRERRAA